MDKDILHITVYTDGACSGNPGPGGWAALLLVKNTSNGNKKKAAITGGETHTTNNRMELTGVIKALRFIHKNLFKKYMCDIRIHSDSSYVINNINGGHMLKWQKNNWNKPDGDEVANKDLWESLADLDNKMAVSFIKVKGHSDNKFNNYVDGLAVKERDKYKELLRT